MDLPGVRDANVARAKVSEQYLQNCSEIWVVAPIKRAVDDGTAKELLGEQFKRRLLMDGQYGNVKVSPNSLIHYCRRAVRMRNAHVLLCSFKVYLHADGRL